MLQTKLDVVQMAFLMMVLSLTPKEIFLWTAVLMQTLPAIAMPKKLMIQPLCDLAMVLSSLLVLHQSHRKVCSRQKSCFPLWKLSTSHCPLQCTNLSNSGLFFLKSRTPLDWKFQTICWQLALFSKTIGPVMFWPQLMLPAWLHVQNHWSSSANGFNLFCLKTQQSSRTSRWHIRRVLTSPSRCHSRHFLLFAKKSVVGETIKSECWDLHLMPVWLHHKQSLLFSPTCSTHVHQSQTQHFNSPTRTSSFQQR